MMKAIFIYLLMYYTPEVPSGGFFVKAFWREGDCEAYRAALQVTVKHGRLTCDREVLHGSIKT